MQASSVGYFARLFIAGFAVLQLSLGHSQSAADYHFNQGKLPAADMMIESMCGVGIEARLLVIESFNWRHHVVVFVYPAKSSDLWVWDPQHKSIQLNARPNNPLAIAKAWVASLVPGERVNEAYFGTTTQGQQCANPAPPAATG